MDPRGLQIARYERVMARLMPSPRLLLIHRTTLPSPTLVATISSHIDTDLSRCRGFSAERRDARRAACAMRADESVVDLYFIRIVAER